MEFNPTSVIDKMRDDNRLFISERDLQVNFIIYAKQLYPDLYFLPEYGYTDQAGNNYRIDLMITDGKEFVAMEFKYATADSVIAIPGNDNYRLKNHAAIDLRQYQCVKDVSRLEAYKKMTEVKCTCGYLLLISNMTGFWQANNRAKASVAFDLKEGCNLSKGCHGFTKGNRSAETYEDVNLENNYENLHYEEYINNPRGQKTNNQLFKYLLVKV